MVDHHDYLDDVSGGLHKQKQIGIDVVVLFGVELDLIFDCNDHFSFVDHSVVFVDFYNLVYGSRKDSIVGYRIIVVLIYFDWYRGVPFSFRNVIC